MALDLGIPDPPRWLVACLMAALIVISSTGCVPADADAARLGSTYSDILLRELRTDREALMELRDSVALERDLALLWVDWIDEEAVPPSHTLMEGARNLARPQSLVLRRRVVGEMERQGHWSAVPEPGLREDLTHYHELAQRFDGLGREEVRGLRQHLSQVLDPEEWVWMFDIPHEGTLAVQFRTSVRQFWNPEFRTIMRMMAVSLGERMALVEDLLARNADLESRVRSWRDAD